MNRIKIVSDKYKQFPTPIKASIGFLFCNFFLKGIGFISSPLYAIFLTVSDYGIMNLFNSYQQIF